MFHMPSQSVTSLKPDHLALRDCPPPWCVLSQVEVVGGGVLLLLQGHVLEEEVLLQGLLAAKVGDELSGKELPSCKETLSASSPSGCGNVHLS